MTFETWGFALTNWQERAVEAWLAGTNGRRGWGTIEVVTGGGKTLIALECAARIAQREPGLKLAVVVPTTALARQWHERLIANTTLRSEDVGLLGAGKKDTLEGRTALVAVLNSAARMLPDLARDQQPLLLIVDEAHRAGAPKFGRVLDTPATHKLGLSATPDREELNEQGEPLSFDEQRVGLALGDVVYAFDLKAARRAGWLPEFELNHHAVTLRPAEEQRYDAVSRQIEDARDELRALGGDTARARMISTQRTDVGQAARRWVTLTGQRKNLLYHASERNRIAVELVRQAFERLNTPRIILFHERVDEATALHMELSTMLDVPVVLEHSKLGTTRRRRALDQFASGTAPVLVSVKSLVEGIDVPAADTGISVASTASVRQRVQSLGRVLRRAADGGEKRSVMHLIYVDGTVDDLIYGKADWTDLTGESANRYWRWGLDVMLPEPLSGPPRTPAPIEDEAWQQIRASIQPTLTGERIFERPVKWPGEVTGQEYSVNHDGVVHNAFGGLIANPQGVAEMLRRLGRHGGRFRVTPQHRLVLVWERRPEWEEPPVPWLVGQLEEPFRVVEQIENAPAAFDPASLPPGDRYDGPSDKRGGSFVLSQRAGGQVERVVKRGREFASAVGDSRGARNARAVIEAWDRLGRPTSKFFVNDAGHAWYESVGSRRFLADVRGGFDWPNDEEEPGR